MLRSLVKNHHKFDEINDYNTKVWLRKILGKRGTPAAILTRAIYTHTDIYKTG